MGCSRLWTWNRGRCGQHKAVCQPDSAGYISGNHARAATGRLRQCPPSDGFTASVLRMLNARMLVLTKMLHVRTFDSRSEGAHITNLTTAFLGYMEIATITTNRVICMGYPFAARNLSGSALFRMLPICRITALSPSKKASILQTARFLREISSHLCRKT